MRARVVAFVVAFVASSLVLAWPSPARACSGSLAATPTAFPASGAADVSPYTSIIVAAGSGLPSGLTLTAGGASVTLPSILTLGSGLLGNYAATFYQLPLQLATSMSYTVSAIDCGNNRELTHFTTAASHGESPGQAPVIDRLRLWRVRYPLEEVGGDSCISDEYEGYIDIDYQDGSVPNTPASEIVTVVSLQAKTGSSVQRFVFAGMPHFDGAAVQNGMPSPQLALWKPTLEPDREYCVSMILYGRNDQAMPEVTSNRVCAPVTNVDARFAIQDASTSPFDSSPRDASAGTDSEYVSLDAGTDEPVVPAKQDGCDCSVGRGKKPVALISPLAALMLLGIGLRRRRAR